MEIISISSSSCLLYDVIRACLVKLMSDRASCLVSSCVCFVKPGASMGSVTCNKNSGFRSWKSQLGNLLTMDFFNFFIYKLQCLGVFRYSSMESNWGASMFYIFAYIASRLDICLMKGCPVSSMFKNWNDTAFRLHTEPLYSVLNLASTYGLEGAVKHSNLNLQDGKLDIWLMTSYLV